jgi:tetratricopeptide (TPR) repeat protein
MNSAEELLKKAMKLAAEEKYEEIINLLDDAVMSQLANAELYFFRGSALFETNKNDRAIEDFDRAIGLTTDDTPSDYYFYRGAVWLDKKKYDKAIADLSKVIDSNPEDSLAYHDRGIAWIGIKEHGKAIIDFNKAIALDPGLMSAYNNRGISLVEKKEYDKAIEDLNIVIGSDECSETAYCNRGMAMVAKKEWDKAITDLNKAIELDPDFVLAYCNRGAAWIGKAEYDKGLADLNKALELDADSFLAYINLGNYCIYKKDYDRAIRCFTRAIELSPNSATGYFNRASVWHGGKFYDKAIHDLTRAIELNPDVGKYYFYAGLVYEAIGEVNLASTYCKRAFYLAYYEENHLIDLFKEKFIAPYILIQLLTEITNVEELANNIDAIEGLAGLCKVWDTYLEHLQFKKCYETNPEKYFRLAAIVNFYMGNSIEAYRIFDTQFDSDMHPYPVMCRDQYYLAIAAADFLEPDDGLTYALNQIQKYEVWDEVSCYYAGRLFFLANDLDSALHYFDKSGNFLPALYGKIGVFRLQRDLSASLKTARIIERIEAAAPDNIIGFLNGIRPLTVRAGNSFEDTFSGVMQLIHYYELTEEINETRALLNMRSGYQHLEFNELLQFDRSFVDEILVAPDIEILKADENEWAARLKEDLQKLSDDRLQHEIYNNVAAGDEFSKLLLWMEKKPLEQSIEDALALRIYNPVVSAGWYNKFGMYYFLKGALDEKAILRLLLYNIHIRMTNYATLPQEYKTALELLSDLLDRMCLPVRAIYGIFTKLLTLFHLNLDRESSTDQSLNYQHFKQHYYQYIGLYKNAGIFRKMPLWQVKE